jgi:hypothetical protein
MPPTVDPNKDLLDVLVQVLVIVIPIVLSWFIRTYVRSSATETNLAAITRLSNSAIDYVENLDKRGDLVLPPEVKKSGYKLKIAGQWLETELGRAGIKINDADAQKWVSAEFQKRVGEVRPISQIADLTHLAVDMVEELDRNKVMNLPPDVDRFPYLTSLATDWVIAQMARNGLSTTREEAQTWVRAEFLERLQTRSSDRPAGDRLTRLADQAAEFLDQLKAGGQIAVQPGAAGVDVETDLAIAWLLTEAAKQGLKVSSDQIAEAAAAALRRRSQGGRALVVLPAQGPA